MLSLRRNGEIPLGDVLESCNRFAHTAIPIFLRNRHIRTLLVGQVFDQYPEWLLLERVAREHGLADYAKAPSTATRGNTPGGRWKRSAY
jgi:hypothetical protein